MLDTNICIYIAHRHDANLAKRLATLKPGAACISVVSYAELCWGASKSADPAKAHAVVNEFTRHVPVMPLLEDVGAAYGEIRFYLQRKGLLIGNNDLWIAAHALAEGLTLVTNNEREFARIPKLKVENWTKNGKK
jgi:tRNA(fMet)-specific endonuclease VapC